MTALPEWTGKSEEPTGRIGQLTDRAHDVAERGRFLFCIRIPQPLLPEDRTRRYAEPIDEALFAERLGAVVGGGQQLGPGGSILYCGVDVVVSERGRSLQLLRDVLVRLQASAGTVIEEFLPQLVEHPVHA